MCPLRIERIREICVNEAEICGNEKWVRLHRESVKSGTMHVCLWFKSLQKRRSMRQDGYPWFLHLRLTYLSSGHWNFSIIHHSARKISRPICNNIIEYLLLLQILPYQILRLLNDNIIKILYLSMIDSSRGVVKILRLLDDIIKILHFPNMYSSRGVLQIIKILVNCAH